MTNLIDSERHSSEGKRNDHSKSKQMLRNTFHLRAQNARMYSTTMRLYLCISYIRIENRIDEKEAERNNIVAKIGTKAIIFRVWILRLSSFVSLWCREAATDSNEPVKLYQFARFAIRMQRTNVFTYFSVCSTFSRMKFVVYLYVSCSCPFRMHRRWYSNVCR